MYLLTNFYVYKKQLRKVFFYCFLWLLFMPYMASVAAAGVPPREIKIGEYLPDVNLDSLNGGVKKISDFKGKPLMINVWASWCGPCRSEMSSLQQLAVAYNGKEFNLIGISTDDYRHLAKDFIKSEKLSFDNFIDHNLVLENILGANTIPLTIFVDAKGKVLEKVRGAYEWNQQQNIKAIGQVFGVKLAY